MIERKGLRCTQCGCAHLPVVYTRQRANLIVRVRVCRHCGKRTTTYERVVELPREPRRRGPTRAAEPE